MAMAAGTHTVKKQRRPTWSIEELRLLVDFMEVHHGELNMKHKYHIFKYRDGDTNKKALYERLASMVSANGVCRSAEECKRKWQDLSSLTKIKHMQHRKDVGKTGDGQVDAKELSEIERLRVISILGKVATSGLPVKPLGLVTEKDVKKTPIGELKESIISLLTQHLDIENDDQADMGTSSNNQDSNDQATERTFLEKAMKEGKTKVYRGRIMLVGHSGAGKTRLLKNLIDSTYDEEEHKLTNGIETGCKVTIDYTTSDFSTDVPSRKKRFQKITINTWDKLLKENHSTPGPSEQSRELNSDIEKSTLTTSHDILRETKNVNDQVLSFWDFGGQVVFYTTHQTFLTESGIYLLVLDLSKELDDKIDTRIQTRKQGKRKTTSVPQTSKDFIMYWLNSIHAYSAGDDDIQPNVIIIGTHTDKIVEIDGKAKAEIIANRLNAITEFLEKEGKTVIKHVEDIMTIDNTLEFRNKENFKDIKKKISEVLKDQEKQGNQKIKEGKKTPKLYWGKKRPNQWLAMEDHLKKKWEEYATYEEVSEELQKVSKWSKEEVDEFLLYQHELGELVYFGGKGDSLVITSPQWLINAFRALITIGKYKKISMGPQWLRLEEEGILTDDLIRHVWIKTELIATEEVKTDILKIMQKYDLICQLPSKNEYLVPCMLKPWSQPERQDQSNDQKEENPPPLHFFAENNFLPDGFFYRLIAHCCSKGTSTLKVSTLNNKYQLFSDYAVFDNISGSSTSTTILKKHSKIKSISIQVCRTSQSIGNPPFSKIRRFFAGGIHSSIESFPGIKFVDCIEYKEELQEYKIKKRAKQLHLNQLNICIPIKPYLPWFQDPIEENNSGPPKGDNRAKVPLKRRQKRKLSGSNTQKVPSKRQRKQEDSGKYANGEEWKQHGKVSLLKQDPIESFQGPTITVCVIDSGIKPTHNIFKKMTIKCWKDGKFILKRHYSDEDGHGTACSGIIAKHAGFVKLVVIKTDFNKRKFNDALTCLKSHQSLKSVDIISISVGEEKYTPDEDRLIKELSLEKIIICAAGNSGKLKNSIGYPANLKGDVICVGSCDKKGNRSSFSSVGETLSFLAQGENIRTASNEGYDKVTNGTSFAAPYVAAVSACVLAKVKKLGYSDEQFAMFKRTRVMEAILKQMCTKPSAHTPEEGHGFLQPAAVLSDDDDFKLVLKKALEYQ